MAHTHYDDHDHATARTDPGGFSAMMIALAVLIVAAVVALAVVWAAPWDDDDGGSTPQAPGIGEQIPVPGEGDGGGTDGGGTDGGGSGDQPQDGGSTQ